MKYDPEVMDLDLGDERMVEKDVDAYGTSEGVTKAWDTRGRGRHEEEGSGRTYYRGLTTEALKRIAKSGELKQGPIPMTMERESQWTGEWVRFHSDKGYVYVTSDKRGAEIYARMKRDYAEAKPGQTVNFGPWKNAYRKPMDGPPAKTGVRPVVIGLTLPASMESELEEDPASVDENKSYMFKGSIPAKYISSVEVLNGHRWTPMDWKPSGAKENFWPPKSVPSLDAEKMVTVYMVLDDVKDLPKQELDLDAAIADLLANYKLDGRTEFQGLNISIENKAGSIREGVGKDGKPWKTKMTHDYGYIRMSEGVDGDYVDCFLGSNPDSDTVYVVHVNDPTTGKYDEDKCFLGFDSAEEAKRAFHENYDDPKFFGSMKVIPFAEFKQKVLATKEHPEMLATSLFHGVKIEGFSGPGEEMIRAGMSRVPPELLANVEQVVAKPDLQPVHGRYDPSTKTVYINPLIFKLRQRFGEGQGWIAHSELALVHEIGHSVYVFMPEKLKDEWRDLSGWMIGWKEGQAPAYEEKRPGWPHEMSQWTHTKGIRFTRKYSTKNADEDFADCFAFMILNKPHQMAKEKRAFLERLIQQNVKNYPQAAIQGPDKAYGERGN